MNEFDFIKSITPKSYQQSALMKGIGDDAAVFKTSDEISVAVDTFVDEIHFSKALMSYADIGYKAVAANLSDLAAMGATAKFYLVSMVIPSEMTAENLQSVYEGMQEIANQYQVDLIGGDTVSGPKLMISVTIIGFHEQGQKPFYRSNAKESDVIFVTGTLGNSRVGLEILQGNLTTEADEFFIEKFRRPKPGLTLTNKLKQFKRLALNDVSDGISSELAELAKQSQVDMTVEDALIPIAEPARSIPGIHDWKYHGGEDFELLGSIALKDWLQLQSIAKANKLQITQIGQVTAKKSDQPTVYLKKNKHISILDQSGYRHLK